MQNFLTIHDLTKIAAAGDILVVAPKVTDPETALELANSKTPGYKVSVVEEVTDPENLNVIQFHNTGTLRHMSVDHTKVAAIKNSGGCLLLIRPPDAQNSLRALQKVASALGKEDLAAAGLAGVAAGVPGGVSTYKSLTAVNDIVDKTNQKSTKAYAKARGELPKAGWRKWLLNKVTKGQSDKLPKELPKNLHIPQIAGKAVKSKALASALLWGGPAALGTLGVIALTKKKSRKEKTAADRAPGKGPQKWETDPVPALEPLTFLSRLRKKLRELSKRKKAEREMQLAMYRVHK